MLYRYQSHPEAIHGWSDSDSAGCHKSRKSTSAGLFMLGNNMLKSGIVVRRSRDGRGVTKAAAAAIGFRSLLSDLGVEWPV